MTKLPHMWPSSRILWLNDLRKMIKTKRAKTFTALTEAEAGKMLASWERAHPKAIIILEKPIAAAAQAVSKTEGTSQVTIYIEYEE